MVLILEKEVLVGAVNSESDGGGAKAGKGALEAFGASEFTGRTPGLAVSGRERCWLSFFKEHSASICTHFAAQGSCSGTRAALRNSLMLNPVGLTLEEARRILFVAVRNRKADGRGEIENSPCDVHFGDGNCLVTSMREWLHTRGSGFNWFGDVDDVVAASRPACGQCDSPVCNSQPAPAPPPPTLSLAVERGPRPPRGEDGSCTLSRRVRTRLYLVVLAGT